MRKKTARKASPLLFQHTPFPAENMQSTFSARKAQTRKRREEIENAALQAAKTKTEKQTDKEHIGMIESPGAVRDKIHDYNVEQAEQQESQERKPAFRRLKSFREMGIEERLTYLFNFPKQLPPVACILTVEENQQIRGFITGKDDKKVSVKLMDGEEISLFTKKITDVRMVGI
ncbi:MULTISPECIES: CotO family spore coat protein [Bacillaceae]|uniref:CotO family spore coat protein n=1 Tax=Bacillaceae TaxID=186817 RepID=UPI001E2F0AE9|nr:MULTISPECIES: CotO family spore coat protein [Bacillaceae]MCE4050496.1 spore coat CotO family protein [Bacillus sp. Au-Bac7]MCM3030517.1 spore coat CotO family protein [Niallia sp. MER 6]MDL0434559.1 CotO family spore coat protein [Niallia sp. SS-2023]UPO88473.1 spore coat CotO family protein [Niallia sp. Man26]